MSEAPRTLAVVSEPSPLEQLADLIRTKRKNLGLKGAEVAAKVGIVEGPFNKIENGKAAPSIETALAIAGVLDLDRDDVRWLVWRINAEKLTAHPPPSSHLLAYAVRNNDELSALLLRYRTDLDFAAKVRALLSTPKVAKKAR